jgi:hypothetical protein
MMKAGTKTTISVDWQKIIEETMRVDDQDAITVAEFVEASGRKRTSARILLDKMVQDGKAIATEKTKTTPHGRTHWVKAYKLEVS